MSVGMFWRSLRNEKTTETRGWAVIVQLNVCSNPERTRTFWPYTLEYFMFRIIANPLISSRMPSSSEWAGRKPVRSIFSFDTM